MDTTDDHHDQSQDRLDRAEARLDDAASSEHPRPYATTDEPTSDPSVLRDEQFREADAVSGTPTVPIITKAQGRGMIGGGAIGAVVGALILLPFSLIEFSGLALGARVVIVLIAGAAAGATAGAVYFGGRAPELTGDSLDADNTPSAGSSLGDPRTDERGR